jgi:hypothetical protein
VQDVDEADGADTDHVREAGRRARLLTFAALTAELAGDFAYLAHAGRSDGVAHG